MTSIIRKKPNKAIILAAGLGTRMRHLSDKVPKPLICVKGRPVIDHILDKLVAAGVDTCVVNVHFKADILKLHLKARQDINIIFSQESKLLNTGGGVHNALHHFADDPFYIVNGDAFWTEAEGETVFDRLADAWDADKMHLLLLLQEVKAMTLTEGVGDYDVRNDMHAVRALKQNGAYMFAGVRLCAPSLFEGEKLEEYSFLKLMDKAEQQGKLYGLIHNGAWHHISSPEELDRVNQYG